MQGHTGAHEKKHYETVASFRIESGVFLFGPRERVVRKVQELKDFQACKGLKAFQIANLLGQCQAEREKNGKVLTSTGNLSKLFLRTLAICEGK